jgi:hypothetical protein
VLINLVVHVVWSATKRLPTRHHGGFGSLGAGLSRVAVVIWEGSHVARLLIVAMVSNGLIVLTGGHAPIELTPMVTGRVWVGVVVTGTFSVAHSVSWLQLHGSLSFAAALLLHVQLRVGLVSVGTTLLLHCLRLASTVNIVLHCLLLLLILSITRESVTNKFRSDRSSRILNFLFLLM